MQKASLSTLELGNLMFGNSRGEFCVEPRRDYQDAFCAFLERNGFDIYGFHKNGEDFFETEKFVIRPYYWGEGEATAKLPNFFYKPSCLEIRWYKYPMRDAYSNQDIDIESFKAILADCESSI